MEEDLKNEFDKLYKLIRKRHNDKQGGVEVRAQKFSIGITFQNGLKMDIVPALKHNEEGDLYLYCNRLEDEDQRLIRTNIEEQKRNFDKSPPIARDLIKLLKLWRDAQPSDDGKGLKFKSYGIELWVIKCLSHNSNRPKGFFNNLVSVFKTMLGQLNQAPPRLIDPGNTDNNVSEDLNFEAIKVALQKAVKTLEQVKTGEDLKSFLPPC